MEDLRDEILVLKSMIKRTKIMNEERKKKLKWLAELMEDVLLEEELTQGFFKDIRGGKAV